MNGSMSHPGRANEMGGYLDPGVKKAPTPNVSLQCGTWEPHEGPKRRSIFIGKPTARKAQSPHGNGRDQEANAANRKGTGKHNWADRAIPTRNAWLT